MVGRCGSDSLMYWFPCLAVCAYGGASVRMSGHPLSVAGLGTRFIAVPENNSN